MEFFILTAIKKSVLSKKVGLMCHSCVKNEIFNLSIPAKNWPPNT